MAERYPNVRRSEQDDLFSDDYFEQIKLLVKSLKDKPLGIVITGRSKTGKSALLAALIGIDSEGCAARDGANDSSSDSSSDSDSDSDGDSSSTKSNSSSGRSEKYIEEQRFEKEGVKVTVWDCPGLQDGPDDESAYLMKLKEMCADKADLMLYCIDMSQPRFADEFAVHNSAVNKITRALGPNVWQHTLVVLTKGNTCAARLKTTNPGNFVREFDERIQDWKTRFTKALKDAGIDKDIVKEIDVQPAGYFTQKSLPGRDDWLSNLWSYVFTTPDPEAQAKILMLNASRLQEEPSSDTKKNKTTCHSSAEQTIVLTKGVRNAIGVDFPQTSRTPEFMGASHSPTTNVTKPPLLPNLEKATNAIGVEIVPKVGTLPGTATALGFTIGRFLGLGAGIGLTLIAGFLKKHVLQWDRVDLRKPIVKQSTTL